MQQIWVACDTPQTAQQGMRLAADLAVACGVPVTLAYARCVAPKITADAGMDALGHLSNVLFAGPQSAVAQFEEQQESQWLSEWQATVNSLREFGGAGELADEVRHCHPDLVIAAGSDLAHTLVSETEVPVWRTGLFRSWYSVRKLRCQIRGERAQRWAAAFAERLGAELEAAHDSSFWQPDADLVVVTRNRVPSLRSHNRSWPLVVV